MATTLELECPSCQELLGLDSGFAGGVCRCSKCGTLMTVPVDSAHGGAERLSRSEAPGGGRPASPRAGSHRADAPGASTGAAEARSGRDQSGMEVYVTDTGRVVEVESERSIPTAPKKRMFVRATTAILFVAVLVGVVGGVVVLGIMLMPEREKPGFEPANLALQEFAFSRDNNPWLMEAPNVLGMSLGEKTVVIVDASASGERQLSLVNSAVVAGMVGTNSGAMVNLIYNTGQGIEQLASSLRPIGQITKSQLEAFISSITASGQPPLRPAVEVAIEYQPRQILLITGRSVDMSQIERLNDILSGQNDLLLDVVSVAQDSPQLEDLARETYGRYEFLSIRTLEQWRAQANGHR